MLEKTRDDLSGHLTIRELRERGWNDRLVRNFLGKPDDMGTSHTPSGGRRPHKLYSYNRVTTVERTKAFQEEKSRSIAFARRAKSISDDKSSVLHEVVDDVVMPEYLPNFDELISAAKNKKNNDLFLSHTPEYQVAVEVLLDRMKLLEDELNLYRWHSGVREARILLKKKMLSHIRKRYPLLAEAVNIKLSTLAEGGAEGW